MADTVIVLDMVNDFVTGEIAAERAERIIPVLSEELLPAARENDVRVIYANDAHRPEDTELDVWGLHRRGDRRGYGGRSIENRSRILA